ncbi:leukocyte receptor cluster member 1-like [Penaeus japonicus]|uniref:leukocyte receptor cluster member 1-like n=1 Tax=Penaeus japonicus TaxID=27405 RepID=UPI001C70D589|nr:leukocyte receptor cluster member 1-like [Penaeus japonicus]
MNILPKKRWHVRTKENIARVRRDEAQAAEEEKQRVYRAKLAEKESRTAILRSKARDSYDGGYSSQDVPEPQKKSEGSADIYTTEGNINFFKDLEDGKRTHGTNKEYEEEKKAEQEKYEKSIGYLTYLGQDSVEATGGKAWYEGSAGRAAYRDEDGEEIQEVGLKSKSKLDPMNDIRKYMGFKPSAKVSAPPVSKAIAVSQVKKEEVQLKRPESISRERDDRHRRKESKKRKKRKKEKHSRKKKRKSYSDDTDDDSDRYRKKYKEGSSKHNKRKRDSSSDDSIDHSRDRKRKKHRKTSRSSKGDLRHRKRHEISSDSGTHSNLSDSEPESSEDEEARKEKQQKLEILRAERLKREAEERKRAERLLAGLNPDEKDAASENKAVVKQKYHSQFNPHLAKQNLEPKPLQSGVKYWLQ